MAGTEMVNCFCRENWAPQDLFHHQNVFRDVAINIGPMVSGRPDEDVSLAINVSPSFPVGMG